MRRSSFIVPLTLAAVCIVGVPARASTSHASALRTVTIVGHGFGHGIGMGQWGARGMAAAGRSWSQIVSHYYSGVRIGRAPATDVRVSLGRRAVVRVAGGGATAWAGRRALATIGRGVQSFRIRPAGGGLELDVFTRRWRAVRIVNGAIVITRRSPVELLSHAGDHAYRGAIQLTRAGARVLVVNRLDIESYLAGVVPREMPASWPREAVRAQAVAARTYVMRVRAGASRPFDICATTACQVYGGYARRVARGRWLVLEDPRANAAIAATRGLVITYRGRPILAQYSSSTGGYSAQGSEPYLRAVPDPYDATAPVHTWRVRLGAARLSAIASVGEVMAVGVVRRAGRRAASVDLRGARGSARISGTHFASALGLRSTWFSILPAPRAQHRPVRRVATRTGRVRFARDFGYGTRAPAVAVLQGMLQRAGYFPRSIAPTGFFGPITYGAVLRYQRAHGIRQTGFVGPLTRASLNAWA